MSEYERIKDTSECLALQSIVEKSLEVSPEITHVISTIRHPGLTSSTRLVTGDIVSNALVKRQTEITGKPIKHSNLIWEANVPGSPNATRLDWRVARGLQIDISEWTFPLQAIPWFRVASDELKKTFDQFLAPSKWESMIGVYVKTFDIMPNLVQERMNRLATLYRHHYVENDARVPLSVASQHVYDDVLSLVFGDEFNAVTPHIPYMKAAKDILVPAMKQIGEEEYKRIISSKYPNGCKTLFYGCAYPEDNENSIGYIGWSPKQKFVATKDRVVDGKPQGNPKDISWETIIDLIEQEKIVPIGLIPMVAWYSDKNILNHGADHGSREEIGKFVDNKSGVLREPHDSWPILNIELEDGSIVEPSLQELFIIFGENNQNLRQILLKSLHEGHAVVMDLNQIHRLIQHD